MNSSQWSPYNQQSFLSSGSPPRLPPSLSQEDNVNSYGDGTSNSLLLTSCQGLQSHTSENEIDITATSLLPNNSFESGISPKEASEYIFNTCKENQSGINNFAQIQSSVSRNEGRGFPRTETTTGYTGQVVHLSYNSSKIDQPSPGPFGVLPHETVKPRVGHYDRGNENFVTPVSKTSVGSYNNGPYADHENVYSSAPLSVQSAYSGDTASPSPVVNSITSSNFSSPSEYYSSPKTNFGAYNNLQSPVPQSPSVAQHSYPSSPYTNIDPTGHISVPPCSPMNGGSYVNNGVPARSGQKTQPTPITSATANVMCYTSQSQTIPSHRPQTVMPKSSDYHTEYNMYSHDQPSPSYPSMYQPMHHGQVNGTNSRISQRTHPHMNSIPPESRVQYGHPTSVPPSVMQNSSYIHNKLNHESVYGSYSSGMPSGQSMHPPKYLPCPSNMGHHQNNSMQMSTSQMMPNHIPNDRQLVFPTNDIVDDKGALELFSTHISPSLHNQSGSSVSNYLDGEFQSLGFESTAGRQLRSRVNDGSVRHMSTHDVSNKAMIHTQSSINEHMMNGDPYSVEMKYNYSPATQTGRSPSRRGRRGRRRRGEMCGSNRWRNYSGREYTYEDNLTPVSSRNTPDMSRSRYYANVGHQRYGRSMTTTNHLPFTIKTENRSNSDYFSRYPRNSLAGFKGPYNTQQVLQELSCLFPGNLPARRKTRNTDKRESGFQTQFRNYLKRRSSEPNQPWPPVSEERTQKPPVVPQQESKEPEPKTQSKKIRLKLKKDTEHMEWFCETQPFSVSSANTEEENASSSDTGILSSHDIHQLCDSLEESNHSNLTGNLSKVSGNFSKPSAKGKNSDKSFDLSKKHLNYFNNCETLPAGKSSTIESQSADCYSDEREYVSKRRRGKTKAIPADKNESKKSRRSPVKPADSIDISVTIKQEIFDEDEVAADRLRSLRSRRSEVPFEPQPGPSTIKDEPPDFSSDVYDNDFDDSDSDPAWMPGTKAPKTGEPSKPVPGPSRKGLAKGRGRQFSSSPKRKRAKLQESNRKKKKILRKAANIKKEPLTDASSTSSGGRGRRTYTYLPESPKRDDYKDQFLIAKSDINVHTPHLWKVDKKSSMLQRYDVYEHNGVRLYRSSYTYAARNESCLHNYVTAEVIVRSPEIVQYLGPNAEEAALVAAVEPEKVKEVVRPPVPFVMPPEIQKIKVPVPEVNPKENFDKLRDDFIVFLQCLLSQDFDSSFLIEIKKFNDDYFLIPLSNMEKILINMTEKLILRGDWTTELKNYVDVFPTVNIIGGFADHKGCQVCHINRGNKFVNFAGQPYNPETLLSVDTTLVADKQFDVCDKCCSMISLYNRLIHSKYFLFNKCHSKAAEVRASHQEETPEEILKLCLEDAAWIDQLLQEQVRLWRDIEHS